MTARVCFKKMLELCFEEDSPELHQELISLEYETKKNRKLSKYEQSMREIIELINVLATDFSIETYQEIERLYENYFENKI